MAGYRAESQQKKQNEQKQNKTIHTYEYNVCVELECQNPMHGGSGRWGRKGLMSGLDQIRTLSSTPGTQFAERKAGQLNDGVEVPVATERER